MRHLLTCLIVLRLFPSDLVKVNRTPLWIANFYTEPASGYIRVVVVKNIVVFVVEDRPVTVAEETKHLPTYSSGTSAV